jgi:hypothetical protein
MLESRNLSKVKTKWNILGLLKTNKTTLENIYICIVLSLNLCKEIIRHLACYEIYVWFQTHIVYALVKQAKNYIKIRYCFKLNNYNMDKCFTKLCAFIVDDVERDNVSLFMYISIMTIF